MPRSYATITLAEAKRMLSAAEVKAESIGIAYNIAVVDAGGHLVAFARQDGALIGSIDLAIDKAMTARLFDKTPLNSQRSPSRESRCLAFKRAILGRSSSSVVGFLSCQKEPSSER